MGKEKGYGLGRDGGKRNVIQYMEIIILMDKLFAS